MKTIFLLLVGAVLMVATPKGADSGITSLSWLGFADQTNTVLIESAKTTLALPDTPLELSGLTPFALVYNEVIAVEKTFVPKVPHKLSTTGNWFVRRRIFNGSTELTSTKLRVNSQALAKGSLQGFPLNATHMEYQLGRIEKVVTPNKGPNGLPVVKSKEVYPLKAVRVGITFPNQIKKGCLVKTGAGDQLRPFPCEFEMVKLQLLGKTGQVIYETKPGNDPKLTLATNEAYKTEANCLIYKAIWTIRRINKATYPVQKGYLVTYGRGSSSNFAAEIDANPPVATGLLLDATIGKEFSVPFDFIYISTTGGGKSSCSMTELCVENDVTKTVFKATSLPAPLRAETHMKLNW